MSSQRPRAVGDVRQADQRRVLAHVGFEERLIEPHR